MGSETVTPAPTAGDGPADRMTSGPEITDAYVAEMIEAVARATGFRMANDRFGFVPALLRADRERVAASARPDPGAGLARELAEANDRLTRERDRLLKFVGFVRVWIHRQTPPNAVNPITDEMRLGAIQHHPMLNDTDACLAGLTWDRMERELAAAERDRDAALALVDEAFLDMGYTVGVIAGGNSRGLRDYDARARGWRGRIAAALGRPGDAPGSSAPRYTPPAPDCNGGAGRCNRDGRPGDGEERRHGE